MSITNPDDAPDEAFNEASIDAQPFVDESIAAAFERLLGSPEAALNALAALDEPLGAEVPLPNVPDDYVDLELVGHGGMGVVFRARQRSLDRVVAIKVLHPSGHLFHEAIRRFQREARLLARLRHPHIVAVHEVGEIEDQIYFTMEWIDGRTLRALLDEGALRPGRAVTLMRQVIGAVAYVHGHGLIHRDLKPGNILVDELDVAYVTDFGLAMEIENDAGLTLTGQVVGTPAYMSPEQARGQLAEVNEASDVYALGVLFYECLTGTRPFAELSPAEQVYAAIHKEPRPPRRVDPRIPEDLQSIALKAMSKRPASRYVNARAMLEDLERYDAGRPIHARPLGRVHRFGRFLKRHHAPIAWGVAAIAVVLVGCLLMWTRPRGGVDRDQLAALAMSLEADGETSAATQLLERALEGAGKPGARLFARLTRLRIAQAEEDWLAGRASRAVESLEAHYVRGKDHFGIDDWEDLGHVGWALATAHAMAAPEAPVGARFKEAFSQIRRRAQREHHERWRAGILHGPKGDPKFAMFVPTALELAAELAPDMDAAHELRRRAAIQQAIGLLQVTQTPHRPLDELVRQAKGRTPRYVESLLRAVTDEAFLGVREGPRGPVDTQRHYLRRYSTPDLERGLTHATTSEDLPHPARKAAAVLLCDLANLPLASAFPHISFEQLQVDAARVGALAARLQSMSPAEALRERVRLAIEELKKLESADVSDSAARSGLGPLRAWLSRHTGVRAEHAQPIDSQRMTAWFAEHGDSDPRGWLGSALGMEATPTPDDIPALLRRHRQRRPGAQPRVVTLLALLMEQQGIATPRLGVHGHVERGFMEAVRALALDVPDSMRLRLARLKFEGGRWHLDPAREIRRVIDPSEPIELDHQDEVPAASGSSVSYALPGMPRTPDAYRPIRIQKLRAQVEWHETWPTFRVLQTTRSVLGGGRISSSGSSGNQADVRRAMSPDLEVKGWSSHAPFRHEFTLLVLENPREPQDAWTLAAWKTRLTADWQRLAAEVEAGDDPAHLYPYEDGALRILLDHQQTLLNMGAIAARLPLPDAIPALRTIRRALGRRTRQGKRMLLSEQDSILAFAQLLGGDESVLDDPSDRKQLDRLNGDDIPANACGRSGEAWVRLLRLTSNERIRAFALERMEAVELSRRAAGDLLDAVREDGLELPATLVERLEQGPTKDRSWWGLVLEAWPWFLAAAALLLLLLLALWYALRPRRSRWHGVVPAAWLVTLGVLLVGLHVTTYDLDHLPDPLGYAAAALGCFLLARRAGGEKKHASSVLFAVAGVASLALRVTEAPRFLAILEATAVLLAIASLWSLGVRLRGGRELPPATRTRSSIASRSRMMGLIVGSAFFLVTPFVPMAWRADVAQYTSSLLVLAFLVWAAASFRWAPATKRLPRLFLLFYVLPMVAWIGLNAWVEWFGPVTLDVDLGAFYLWMFACGVCVLWTLLGLIQSARVRAAYQRLTLAGAQTPSE